MNRISKRVLGSGSTRSALLAAIALAGSLAGCKAIVGIEEYEGVRDAGDDGGKGGKGGRGGSGGRGGNSGSSSAGTGGKGGSSAGTGGKGGSSGSTSDKDASTMDAMTPAPDGGDAMTPIDPCELYCQTVQENCKDEYDVYASPQTCMAVCRKLPLGDLTAEEPLGNSVACRLHQAQLALATSEPADHCPAAGPGGAGICGSNCESYCMLNKELCPDLQPELQGEKCLANCPALRDLDDERASFDQSTFDVVAHHDGDFLQCRLVHLSSAGIAPTGHCWHAALVPRAHPDPMITEPNPCADVPSSVPRCRDYCQLHLSVCTGDQLQYENMTQCLKLCESLDKGTNGDYGNQNTVGCRRNHSYNAMVGGASTHCPHSGPGGHVVCGANCDSYCTAVASACGTAFAAKYPAGRDACLTECNAIPDNGAAYSVVAGKSSGNKFFCRLLHTGRAFENANECPAALGGGDCQ